MRTHHAQYVPVRQRCDGGLAILAQLAGIFVHLLGKAEATHDGDAGHSSEQQQAPQALGVPRLEPGVGPLGVILHQLLHRRVVQRVAL